MATTTHQKRIVAAPIHDVVLRLESMIGREVSSREGMTTLQEAIDAVKSEVSKREESMMQFAWLMMTSHPTIAEIRQMNRDGLLWWPLPFLNALIDAGLDLTKRADATVHWTTRVTEQLVDCYYRVMDGNMLIARIGVTYSQTGEPGFVAMTRMKVADWLA